MYDFSKFRASFITKLKMDLSKTSTNFYSAFGEYHVNDNYSLPLELVGNVNRQCYRETENSNEGNEDIAILQNNGDNRLFPTDPKMGVEFKSYLQRLGEVELPTWLEQVKASRTLEKDVYDSEMSSYSMITTEDLKQVQMEREKIIQGTRPDLTNLGYVYDTEEEQPSMEVFRIHQFLITRIILAKKCCLVNHLKKADKQENATLNKIKELYRSLVWQFYIQKELYRQSLMTPSMEKKRGRPARKDGESPAKSGRKKAKTQGPGSDPLNLSQDFSTINYEQLDFDFIIGSLSMTPQAGCR